MLANRRLNLALCAAIGIGVAAVLATYAGLGTVYSALNDVGWLGLAWICMLQLSSMALCAAAWKSVADNTSFLSCLTARFIRDGVSNLAGIIPAVGEIAGARALSLLGATAGVAAASTVVDVAVESLAQAIYTIIGLIPLLFLVQPGELTRWLAVIAVATAPIFAVFVVTRRRGALRLAERIIIRISHALGFPAATDLDLSRNVLDIYQRRRHVWFALLLHLAGWFVSAVQLWAAAQAMDRPLSPGEALALQSLVYAARGAFFFVPWGLGVQEGTFVLVGAVLGVDAASALALSLILRARDIVLGLPAIIALYTAEGRRRWLLVRVPTRKR
jgi:putative membrane protein